MGVMARAAQMLDLECRCCIRTDPPFLLGLFEVRSQNSRRDFDWIYSCAARERSARVGRLIPLL